MIKEFKKGEGSSFENLEGQKYQRWQEAIKEHSRIIEKINNTRDSAIDKNEAGIIILSKLYPLLSEAEKKSSEAFGEWREAMREASERDRKEIEDLKKSGKNEK